MSRFISCLYLAFNRLAAISIRIENRCVRCGKVMVLYCIVVGSRRLMLLDALQPKAYCTNPGLSRSYLHRQVSPLETLVVKGGTTWARNGR